MTTLTASSTPNLPAAEQARRGAAIEKLRGGGAVEFVEVIVDSARHAGDKLLFTDRDRTWTGHEVADAITGAVRFFYAEGMRKGDVVLLGARPGIEAMIALLASMRLGAISTVIDPGAGHELFARRLELMRPGWVIAESLLYAASARTPLRTYTRSKGMELPHLAKIPSKHIRVGPWVPGTPTSAISFRKGIKNAIKNADDPRSAMTEPGPAPDDTGIVFFTSGTTGHPKGVQHTGKSSAGAIRMMMEHFSLPETTVFYNHNLHSYVATIIAGAYTKIAPLKMEPKRYAAEVTKNNVTHAFIRPVDAYNLVTYCEESGTEFPQSLREMYLYSAPVTTTILKRLIKVAHPDLNIVCIYGMTESALVAWVDGHTRAAWEQEGDLVGKPCPGVEVRVDENGVLETRSDNVHKGYVGMEEIDWHSTGDLARIDPDGSIVLLGRAKDMLLRGHFNLYPSLYEDTICRIEGVAACAIVGVPDPEHADETVHLFIEPHPGVDPKKLKTAVAKGIKGGSTQIDIAAHPDMIHVIDELPRSGRAKKIARKELSDIAARTMNEGTPAS